MLGNSINKKYVFVHSFFNTQMKVFAKGGLANTPPHPVNVTNLYWLKSIDDTTASVRLLYSIVRHSRSVNLLSSFSGSAITTFFQGDLPGSLVFHSLKDVNATIRIQVMDDEEAVTIFETPITINYLSRQFMQSSISGVTVQEGSSTRLSNFPKLKHAEKCNISLYKNGPKLGKILVNGWSSNTFTLENVLSGAVYYENTRHGEWDPLFMKIEYKKQSVDVVYPIAIFTFDSRHPVIKAGKSLTVRQNELNLASLLVNDLDSAADEINFRLEDIIYGTIFFRKNIDEEIAVSEWNHVDMSEGRIIYRVTVRPKGGGTDVIKLKLSDSAVPSNVSPVQHIKVTIMKDVEPPRPITNRPLHISRTATRLTGLVYKDLWPSHEIIYTVEEKQLKGDIWLEDGVKVTNFTQSQLDRGQVWYEPASNVQDTDHSMYFSVIDGDGNILTDQVNQILQFI
uniref:Cadherin domain-containing protein n=1 Tax=Rhodnius prolixus TaxID=13249 RepID=A0A905QWP4_RHOPR